MEEYNPEELYKIDEKHLLENYSRIENSELDLSDVEAIKKFLINQAIGTENEFYNSILKYFKDKLAEGKTLLDFALEWIRAVKIRFEYKKYLAKAQFQNYELAIDECIFLFFLKYDNYIRNLFSKNIKEFEICSLYEIFFSPNLPENFDMMETLEKYKLQVPTIFYESDRINTNIITLRSALTDIIKKDYESISKKSPTKISEETVHVISKGLTEKEKNVFSGPFLERIIKSYCINKDPETLNDLEKAIGQFLGSYFQFGELYKFDDFAQSLEQRLIEILYTRAPEQIHAKFDLESLKTYFKEYIEEYRENYQKKELDGTVWKKDLTPLLKNYIHKIVDEIY
jgi:hypothetical protein